MRDVADVEEVSYKQMRRLFMDLLDMLDLEVACTRSPGFPATDFRIEKKARKPLTREEAEALTRRST